ncbi:MAG: hypothetical protein CL583_07500 [Alteromonadaceae bacterium]|jgi:Flp pilus assembly pilin Flp|uniref:hypothetical protein n=1 Tax=Marinobacter shengliensis TaxID=1389223 RepID=UPI000C0A9EB6|nr:hypothetical protein [Marinobacter shengliensis]MAL98283.1 hypothetical protein [Alteromonadaceae bacterium]BEH15249.1 hypothetical protein MAALD49_26170 [Marinobacter shengliensis]|tara:strand:- start:6999 stop:7211 length:213 start_codon:yes stop_codon:yes gene_type:complete
MKTARIFRMRSGAALAKLQKGASSLEYLMLGAVVIAILIAVIGLNDDIATTISETLSNLFGEVQDAASSD